MCDQQVPRDCYYQTQPTTDTTITGSGPRSVNIIHINCIEEAQASPGSISGMSFKTASKYLSAPSYSQSWSRPEEFSVDDLHSPDVGILTIRN